MSEQSIALIDTDPKHPAFLERSSAPARPWRTLFDGKAAFQAQNPYAVHRTKVATLKETLDAGTPVELKHLLAEGERLEQSQ